MATRRTKKKDVPLGYAAVYAASIWVGRDQATVRKIIREAALSPMKIGVYKYYKVSDIVAAILGNDDLDLQQERAKLARKQCEKTELQIKEAEGRLVPAEEVAALWQRMVSSCRAKLLSIPTKAAPLVMAAESQNEVKEILKAQVHESLKELSRKLVKIAD
jgi:hypothetical protein